MQLNAILLFALTNKPRLTWIVFKYSARTAKYAISISLIKTDQLLLYWEIITVCTEIYKTVLCWQKAELLNVACGGTRSGQRDLQG